MNTRPLPQSSSTKSSSSVRKGERIARPLVKPGRITYETLVVDYKPTRNGSSTTHRISPGTAFRRETSTSTRYYMFCGVSAEDPECLYFFELGPDKHGASIAYGLPQLINRAAWVNDYEGGFSDYERIPLSEAAKKANKTTEDSTGFLSGLF